MRLIVLELHIFCNIFWLFQEMNRGGKQVLVLVLAFFKVDKLPFNCRVSGIVKFFFNYFILAATGYILFCNNMIVVYCRGLMSLLFVVDCRL